MNYYIKATKAYITANKQELTVGTAVILVIIALITVIALLVHNSSGSKIVYQPIKACDLLTKDKAQDLLGGEVIGVDAKEPVISNDVATSKCSYTDTNVDKDKMVVAAIAVRSGINDKGVQQNKTEFANGKPQSAKTVKNVGDSAYFNREVGQLNVLHDKKWIIVSYGVGADPQSNTIEKAVVLAKKALN